MKSELNITSFDPGINKDNSVTNERVYYSDTPLAILTVEEQEMIPNDYLSLVDTKPSPTPLELKTSGASQIDVLLAVLTTYGDPKNPTSRAVTVEKMVELYPKWKGGNSALYVAILISQARKKGVPIISRKIGKTSRVSDYIYTTEEIPQAAKHTELENEAPESIETLMEPKKPVSLNGSHKKDRKFSSPTPRTIHGDEFPKGQGFPIFTAPARKTETEKITESIPSYEGRHREELLRKQVDGLMPTDKAAGIAILERYARNPISASDWLHAINKVRPYYHPLHGYDLEAVTEILKNWCGIKISSFKSEGKTYFFHRS